jgi:hypothetical protein
MEKNTDCFYKFNNHFEDIECKLPSPLIDGFMSPVYVGNSDKSIPYAPTYVPQFGSCELDTRDLEDIKDIFGKDILEINGSNTNLFDKRSPSCGMTDVVYSKFDEEGKPIEMIYQDGTKLPIPLKNSAFKSNVESAIQLLSSRSKLPTKDYDSQSQFLKICYTFVSGFLFSNIWRISNYNMPKTSESSAYFKINDVKKAMGRGDSLFLCLDTRILSTTQYQGYIFSESRIIDKDTHMIRPIPNKIFSKMLLDYYDRIAITMGYKYSDSRCRYSRRNKYILLIEIKFKKKP